MKFVEQSGEIIKQEYTLDGIYKIIEKVARNCYKSEDKICEGSAKKMVDFLVEKKHYGMLRHGTVYLRFLVKGCDCYSWKSSSDIRFYIKNRFSICNFISKKDDLEVFVTTNYLVLLENNRLKDLQFICEPTIRHAKRTTISFTTSIAINRELQTQDGQFGRARAEESTRYCNYSKDKFNNELTFVIPEWTTLEKLTKAQFASNITQDNIKEIHLLTFWRIVEDYYNKGISLGMLPQEARDMLAMSTKSTLYYTLFDCDWKHVFNLRTSRNPGAHPMMKQLMDKVEYKYNNS